MFMFHRLLIGSIEWAYRISSRAIGPAATGQLPVAASDGIPDRSSVSAIASVLIVNDFIVPTGRPIGSVSGFLSLLVDEQPRYPRRRETKSCAGESVYKMFSGDVKPSGEEHARGRYLSERISHLAKWIDREVRGVKRQEGSRISVINAIRSRLRKPSIQGTK
jgi:hypothetical protein